MVSLADQTSILLLTFCNLLFYYMILAENMASQEINFSPNDRRNPRAWSVRKKSLISIVCAVSFFVV